MGFANVELRHRYTINSPGSGSLYIDDVYFRQTPAPSATNWTTLVPFGANWKYNTNNPPAGWAAAAFNDTGWPIGTAKFGNGSGPTNITTRLPQLLPGYYFRKTFVMPANDVEELLLSATCTDVSVAMLYPLRVFLNGVEVKATIDTVTAQGNEVRHFDLLPFANLLKSGMNVIAIQLSNYWSDYDDIAFDVSLKAVMYHPVLPKASLAMSGSNAPSVSVETPPGMVCQIQSCDNMRTNVWQTMQVFTNSAGGVKTYQDTGQNGRAAPGSVSSRYYRVVQF